MREETDEIMKQLEEERDPEAIRMTHLTVQQMVFSNPYKIRYHCHLQYRHQKDKEITAKIQNIFKIRAKMSENRIQRREKREEMRRSSLRKENRASFKNILENRWIRWQVSAIYTYSRGKTDVTRKNKTKTLHQPLKHRKYKQIRMRQT